MGGRFQNEAQYFAIDLRISIIVFFKKNTIMDTDSMDTRALLSSE
jgi:hypothetical protein